jgi:hypothetical protein
MLIVRAAWNGNLTLVRLLSEAGVPPDTLNGAYRLLRNNNLNPDIVKFLRDQGAK